MSIKNSPAPKRKEFLEVQKQNKQYYSIVKKSNAIIQKARYSFSLQQQKFFCYLFTNLSDTATHET